MPRLELIALLGGLLVVVVRLFTTFGIPGWTSTMLGDLLIILMQTVVIAVAATLMVLSNRCQRPVIPFADAPAFVANRHHVTLARDMRTDEVYFNRSWISNAARAAPIVRIAEKQLVPNGAS